jgi:hypothetical protein
MPRYAIVYQEHDPRAGWTAAFWTTRVGNTDNYTTHKPDATTFPDSIAARCLMRTLGLGEDHFVVEV